MNLRKRITDRMKVQTDILTPFQRKPLKRFGIHIPSEPWGLSPADSRGSSPARFWRVFARRARTSPPSFIQSYSSQRLITGLSSAYCHGRSHSANSSYPRQSSSGFPSITYQYNPQRSLSLLSPARESSRAHFPSEFRFSVSSAELKLQNYQSPTEPD